VQYFRSKFPRDIATAPKNNELSIGMVIAPEKTGHHEHKQAEDAVRELHRAGFKMKQLSIVGKGYRSEEYPIGFYTLGDRMKTWGSVGVFWGALWGMLFGAAFFWVPGVGLLGAAGPFVHVLVGALEGAAVGRGVSVCQDLGGNPREFPMMHNHAVWHFSFLVLSVLLLIVKDGAPGLHTPPVERRR
jgi:hypothetical protein